ncbi:hypothetical protein RF11_09091 [Thelohanellus kitauei]|uniref:Uncharacterized protein n=1 Tax=Thelohanellus kitauei TaxID=669202 RepID=A0A0C2NDA1_THEKT|nr:hypothetical protein RF11_09091 [Thelohanellus kitauei]
MESSQNIDTKANKRAIQNYRSGTQSNDVYMQIEAIKNFISHFSNQDDWTTDRYFIKNFPSQIYKDFYEMSEGKTNLDLYQEKQILLLNVYTFIFRNKNLMMNFEAESIATFFLKFIRFRDPNIKYDPSNMMDSILIYVSHYPYKLVIIHGNAMLRFLCYFDLGKSNLKQKFWSMCQKIYELHENYKCFISYVKLTESVNQIMNKYSSSRQQDFCKLLTIVLNFVRVFDLLDYIEFDVTMFYRISEEIFSNETQKLTEDTLYFDIYKIWKAMLNGSVNTLRIESTEQLVTFTSIFSVGLARKLKKLIQDTSNIEMNKNVKNSLYIIYFSLIAYPVMNEKLKNRLRQVLLELHRFFQKYFEKCSFQNIPIYYQFEILQYYIKSIVTLNVEISPHDHQTIRGFLDGLIMHSTLNLHWNFLFAHLLFDISFDSTNGQSDFASNFNKINQYLHRLIYSLSDEIYTNKLKWEQKLYLFENLKCCYLKIFSEELIQSVFTGCESHLLDMFKDESPEVVGNNAYEIYSDIMCLVVQIFNDSNYLEKSTADSLRKLCDEFSNEILPISSYVYDSDNVEDTSVISINDQTERPIAILLSKRFLDGLL